MDRRYTQTRFYGGVEGTNAQRVRSEALVRAHLAQARKAYIDSQSYGGSTGGSSSTGNSGLDAILNRNADLKEARQIFKDYGSGDLGSRAALAEARGFRQQPSAVTGLS